MIKVYLLDAKSKAIVDTVSWTQEQVSDLDGCYEGFQVNLETLDGEFYLVGYSAFKHGKTNVFPALKLEKGA